MDLQQLKGLALRFTVIVVAMTVLGAIVGYALARSSPRVYRAEGRLLVLAQLPAPGRAAPSTADTTAPPPPAGILSDASQVVGTAAALLVQRPLLERVSTDLHLSSDLEGRIKPVPEPGTAILDVDVTDRDPALAATIANTVMKDFIDEMSATQDLPSAETLAAQDAQAEQQVRAIEQERSTALLRNRDLGDLDRQLEKANGNLAQLDSALGTRNAGAGTSPVAVIQPAAVPAVPSSAPFGTTLGAFAGLLVGVGLAVLLGYFDESLRSEADVTRHLGLPTVGSIPTTSAAAEEEFRRLRANLLFTAGGTPITSVVVTSARRGEGTSRIAANLATAVAASGQRVLLVDADLRDPTQHRIFHMSPGPGLSDFLQELARRPGPGAAGPGVERPTAFPNLSVMTAGGVSENPAELLGSPHAARVLRELEGRYDLVVVDAPAVGAVADALGVASGSATLLVVDASRTRAAEVRPAVEALRNVGATILGVVLTRTSSGDIRLPFRTSGTALAGAEHRRFER